MTKIYYFEGKIFETVDEVERYAKTYINKKYDIITTNKSYEQFEEDFEKLKDAGESDFDAIEWAR